MAVTIYGTSDDLIEIEGDIREEFYHIGDEDGPTYFAFSDGTVISVSYTFEGIWRIFPVVLGTGVLNIKQAVSSESDDYSDRAELTGDIRWLVVGNRIELAGR